MGKDEILVLLEKALQEIETKGKKLSEREFQLAVLLTLKWLLEHSER